MTTWVKWFLIAVVVLMVAGVVLGEDEAPDEPAPGVRAPAEKAEEPENRCRRAPRALLRAIEGGLRPSADAPEGMRLRGGRLSNGYIVRSKEPWPLGRSRRLYFISAMMRDSANEIGVATWVSNDPRPGGGLIIASDAVAKEFSVWGADVQDGAPLDISFTEDGGPESRACAED